MSRLPQEPTGTDAFVHALDGFMHRHGQGVHRSQSILVLGKHPSHSALRTALADVLARHPILTAWVRKRHLAATPRFVQAPAPATEIPFEIHPASAPPPSTTPLFDLLPAYPTRPGFCNIRCDLFPLTDGTSHFVLTWRHQILDAIGAELLIQEIAAPGTTEGTSQSITHTNSSFTDLWKRTSPIVTQFWAIRNPRFSSLAGPRIQSGDPGSHRITLTQEETATIKARASQACGLVQTPFFLAAVTRAHAALFTHRGTPQKSYVVNTPIQLRKRRARMTPIFQNHLAMEYYAIAHSETATLEALTTTFQKLQESALKQKLAHSFRDLLQLMRRMPASIYIPFVRTQWRGEFNSFYHSLTGEFAPHLKEFHGANITNAWHAPALYAPPGSGIFANEKNGQLTLVFAWREPGVTRADIDLMEKHLLADLLG